MTACRNCGWTSGKRVTKDGAIALGQLHEQDNPGHSVELKEVAKVAKCQKAGWEFALVLPL